MDNRLTVLRTIPETNVAVMAMTCGDILLLLVVALGMSSKTYPLAFTFLGTVNKSTINNEQYFQNFSRTENSLLTLS